MSKTLPPGIVIVEETPQDFDGIRRVNQLAFKGDSEADVIEDLRLGCPEMLSLVARQGDLVIGHILFSPAQILPIAGDPVSGMGLAPLAVHPDYQGQGIGSALCQAGLQRMAEAGVPFVIVLGHPAYYPRFGFVKASAHGISSAYKGVPDEAFMVRIFDPERMADVKGVAHYRPEFDRTV